MELLYQIALTLIPGIGDINGKRLISYCGGLEAVFTEKKAALLKIPGIGPITLKSILNKSVFDLAEKEIRFIEKFMIQTTFFLDENYPHRLKNCEDSPMLLYYKGNADLNDSKVLSIVGTRKASAYGRKICKEIIEDLKDLNVLIVSGLAYGIDTHAHKNAVIHGLPTVGILAHGLDRIYPAANRALAEKMLNRGGLLTEFRSETNPDRENFPRRNRIVSGLSDATLVIESALKGGALITAEIANSYNRDVFAVPGRTTDRYSEGCNFLIKTHRAALIQTAKDLKYILGWDELVNKTKKQQKIFINLNAEEQKIVDLLKVNEILGIDQISIKMDSPTSKIASTLLNLEFQGVVQCLPGKVFKLI